MSKWLKVILILILISVLFCAFFRHGLCRFLISSLTTNATGLKLSIADLNLDILHSSLCIRGITLLNPPGFENEVLGKAKEIFIKYDLSDLLRGRFHLREARLDISQINIIRNEKGKSNVATFKKKRVKAKQKPSKELTTAPAQKEPAQKKPEPRSKEPRFLIDSLEISLEKATYMDYSAGVGEPAVIIFTMKGPQVFENVTDLNYVVKSVSTEGGFRYLLNNLLEKIPKDLLKNAGESIKKRLENVLPGS